MKKIIGILLVYLYCFNVYGQGKLYTIKEYKYIDDKHKLNMQFSIPVFTIKNIAVNKKINDSINNYIEYWKKEAVSRILYLESVGISKTDYQVNIKMDTITLNGENIYLLFSCSDINFSMAKYTFWYDVMAFSLITGNSINDELKKKLDNNVNKKLFDYVNLKIKNNYCKPRIEYQIEYIIPVNDKWYYIPYSIEYAEDVYSCMSNNMNILKIFISNDDLYLINK
jgi:hypothetical protein